MEVWDKADFYQTSESEGEYDEALSKLNKQAQSLQPEDLELDLVVPEEPDVPDEELKAMQSLLAKVTKELKKSEPEKLSDAGRDYWRGRAKLNKLLALQLNFYMLLKEEGRDTRGHPVLASIKKFQNLLKAAPAVEEAKYAEAEPEVGVKRRADNTILKNKGIVRKRKKIERNSRVKLRVKYAKAERKHKATFGRTERTPEVNYRGEATGIRKDLVKSIKLK
mmetsp:Transcript_31944/g.55036  ORF Transcript_31944/g.55036 Transcript_31944/m.55036 type:complete len:222 (+) Transcript_31944:2104-2769(+)